MLAYLDSLPFDEAIRLLAYVFAFGMFIRLGFRYADWILDGYKWFFSSFGKSCRFWIAKGFRFLIVHFQAHKKKDR